MAVRTSRDYLEALWRLSGDGAILLDGRLRIVTLNPAAERVLGQLSRQVAGRPIREILDTSRLNEALSQGKKAAFGTLQLNLRAFQWSLRTIPVDGSLVGTLVVLREAVNETATAGDSPDVSNLKGILAALLDGAYEGIAVVNADGQITLINEAYCEFLGVKAEDVIGKPVEQVLENTRLPVVLKTGQPEFRQVQRMRGHDTICDRIPIRDGDRVVGAVGRVLFRDVSEVKGLFDQTVRLQQELEYYKGRLRYLQSRYSLEGMIGQSRAIIELKEMIGRMARSNSTVLLRGESGTGKELVAHAIHHASDRSHESFVQVNCAAIPEALLESELFGYEEGAFTGARRGGKVGKFEQADKGTILLDEIGDMPLGMQSKLLRVLQERQIERVGGTRPVKVDVRVIAATNKDLDALVADSRFRQDLYYRLNVVALDLPPLRERPEDIPLLVEHLLSKLGRALGCGRKQISTDALEILKRHSWPGNVRELENVLERALNVVDGVEVLPRHLPVYLTERQNRASALPLLKDALARTERELLKQALLTCKGDHGAAARLLGVSRSTFYEKTARHHLD